MRLLVPIRCDGEGSGTRVGKRRTPSINGIGKRLLEIFDEGTKAARRGLKGRDPPPYGRDDDEKGRELISQIAERFSMEAVWNAVATPLVVSTVKTAVKQFATEVGIAFDLP